MFASPLKLSQGGRGLDFEVEGEEAEVGPTGCNDRHGKSCGPPPRRNTSLRKSLSVQYLASWLAQTSLVQVLETLR